MSQSTKCHNFIHADWFLTDWSFTSWVSNYLVHQQPFPRRTVLKHNHRSGMMRIYLELWCVFMWDILFDSFFLNVASDQGSRKLSYAEVCQRLAKDSPPAQTPSPLPATSPVQPLQELKVNKVEELRTISKCKTDKPQKDRVGRPFRQPLQSFRGANAQAKFGGAGLKVQEQQRRKYSSQQGSRRSGKEQNIPPSSPKWPPWTEKCVEDELHQS